ncbi:MAG: capsular polysaccharide synthesis protein [Cyanobacteriota bacterium]|nr:capsular polysaccharide synthesis protein [Cyanobacteriota bacterium]
MKQSETINQKISRIFGHFAIAAQKPFLKLYAKLKQKQKNKQKLMYRDILTVKQKKYLSRYLYVLSDQPIARNTQDNKIIWFCWLQGEKNAPPIIAECLKNLRRYCPDYEIVVLTWKNISQYADIPDYIYEKNKKGIITNTQFSDLLRLALLTKNGGIWIDSTVFLTEPLPKEITQSRFFSLHADSYVKNNSWLIKSSAGNVLLEKLKCLMFEYWRYETKMLDYFLFHIFFDLLVENDEECADIWRKTPVIYDDCYDLESHYFQKFDEQTWQRIKQKTSIHKLSWKYKKEPKPDTFLARLLSGNLN